jgi:hypothetical protein
MEILKFRLYPLLKKDGLGLAYVALLLLWNSITGVASIRQSKSIFVKLIITVRRPESDPKYPIYLFC